MEIFLTSMDMTKQQTKWINKNYMNATDENIIGESVAVCSSECTCQHNYNIYISRAAGRSPIQ